MGKITLCTLNSTGLSQQRVDFIDHLITTKNPDLLFLQETWLLGSQLRKLSTLHHDFIGHGVTGMDERHDFIGGRPYGGLAILWKKSLAASVQRVRINNSRLCAITLSISARKLLVLNAYLPCDNYSSNNVDAQYQAVLDDAMRLWLESDADSVIFGGDLNTDPRRDNAHSAALCDFIRSLNASSVWCCAGIPLIDTYISYDGRGRSCIDHFIVSNTLSSHVANVNVYDCPLNGSNHSPLFFDVDIADSVNADFACLDDRVLQSSIAWGRVTNEHIESYQMCVSARLDEIPCPPCFETCLGSICNSEIHKSEIDRYCEQLCDLCAECGQLCFPVIRPNNLSRPKWNNVMKPLKDEAMCWDAIWKECGKPGSGHIWEIRQRTKREYHYAFRRYKKRERNLRKERMGEELRHSNSRQFWSEVRKVNPKKSAPAPVVDGKATQRDIAEVFLNKFEHLFNSVQSNADSLHSITGEIDASLADRQSAPGTIVTLEELNRAMRKLKDRKHEGLQHFWSNYLRWLPPSVREKLCLLLSAMLSHGHTPSCINLGTIISIPKDPAGDICSSDNYRGIALSSSLAKLMEIILIAKCGASISSSNLQFAYKANHSTTMCTLLLKETAAYFVNRKSSVYCALVDASKAFDRLSHDKLFRTLLDRQVPPEVVRFLIDNYRRQRMQVKWGATVSGAFGVENGVKQGGILSPILFNVYMDILLKRLENRGIGCHIGETYLGSLAYADDLTLLSPSLQGLQEMLRECEKFGDEYKVIFNPVKTQCIEFCRGKNPGNYQVHLDGKELTWVRQVIHLGHVVTFDLSEVHETKKKGGDFIYNVNSLRANFKGVDLDVLLHLFNAHCTSFYGSQSWDLSQSCVNSVYSKFNRGVRMLLNLPFRTHRDILYVLLSSLSLEHQLAQRFSKMRWKMINSTNHMLNNVSNIFISDSRSILSKNFAIYNDLERRYIPPSDELIAKCNIIREVLDCIYSNVNEIPIFEGQEISTFLESICCL